MQASSADALGHVKALVFDVFGTVVDWRTSVTDELILRAHRKLSSHLAPPLQSRLASRTADDWARFAQAWRDSYRAFTLAYNPHADAWKTVDAHHLDSLVALLRSEGLDGIYTDAEVESLSLVWHRLAPWPDAADGLAKLGARYTTSTLSNGNLALLRDLDDYGLLAFHKLLSAETFRAYKPDPATYLGAARELGVEPAEVAMVAAHLGDLEAARACGLRTIYVERPREESWGENEQRHRRAGDFVDLWITEEQDGLLAVNEQLLSRHP
ncbi:hypothetical protein DCS_01564 [Drechmeria coniospora]|uniref:Haloacid dehalogenase, type II n=1 Tax=Drechmeria coniospora TaxID=98403 RepID=A0A151GTK3_DRECN|nr:hypothetical protein DCS_01564 [Drechmeria coniospora]KYK60427.1 hypothetical protein DCS_01564 [Drechmeria coniospora]